MLFFNNKKIPYFENENVYKLYYLFKNNKFFPIKTTKKLYPWFKYKKLPIILYIIQMQKINKNLKKYQKTIYYIYSFYSKMIMEGETLLSTYQTNFINYYF